LQPKQVEVIIARVEDDEEIQVNESELDEMWSFVSKKSNPRWLWHAIDRSTGQVLAYVFGRRNDGEHLRFAISKNTQRSSRGKLRQLTKPKQEDCASNNCGINRNIMPTPTAIG